METPVSGPPQIQVFQAQATLLARPNSGVVAYAFLTDSARSFPGAPHVHSEADGCVMVRDGAAAFCKSLRLHTFAAIYIQVSLISSRWLSFLQRQKCWSAPSSQDNQDTRALSSLIHSQIQAHQHGQQHEDVNLGLDQE